MTTAQVVEMSVTVTNSSFQNYTHPDDHTTRTPDVMFQPKTTWGLIFREGLLLEGNEWTCEVSGKSVANSWKYESPNLPIFTKKHMLGATALVRAYNTLGGGGGGGSHSEFYIIALMCMYHTLVLRHILLRKVIINNLANQKGTL